MTATKSKRHNQETILFILMGLIVVGLIVSGYFLFVKKILPELASTPSQNPSAAIQVSPVKDEAAAAFIPDDEAQVLTLYFPKKNSDSLRAELRKVRQKKMLTAQAGQIVEELFKGPTSSDLYSPYPEGTGLRGIYFDDSTFFVDLSIEFGKVSSSGAAEEVLAVYSLVNSLTEIDPRAKVRILINGIEPIGDSGHVDLAGTMTRFPEMISE